MRRIFSKIVSRSNCSNPPADSTKFKFFSSKNWHNWHNFGKKYQEQLSFLQNLDFFVCCELLKPFGYSSYRSGFDSNLFYFVLIPKKRSAKINESASDKTFDWPYLLLGYSFKNKTKKLSPCEDSDMMGWLPAPSTPSSHRLAGICSSFSSTSSSFTPSRSFTLLLSVQRCCCTVELLTKLQWVPSVVSSAAAVTAADVWLPDRWLSPQLTFGCLTAGCHCS